MIAWRYRIVYHRRCADETDFCLDVLLLLVLLLEQTLALPRFGIFSQANTKAATSVQAWRWW